MTKNPQHDSEMKQVYEHIYQDFYRFEPVAMESAREIITKNLHESGVQLTDIPSLNIFNIGTGREALVFHELGAKNILHVDVSNISVDNIQRLKQLEPRFSNLHSQAMDICSQEPLNFSHEIDFVFLNGVLHHLYDPKAALVKISSLLSPKAKLFFRIYRSGSLAFFVTDFVRRFVSFEDISLIKDMFNEVLANFSAAERKLIYEEMYDDFFVPVLKLYDPTQIDKFFLDSGFELIRDQEFEQYDHANHDPSGQGWSLYYKKVSEGSAFEMDFPEHVDQLHGIQYGEESINLTIELMDQFLDNRSNLSDVDRITVALELYASSQNYRRKSSLSSDELHGALQQTLKGYLP